MQLLTLFSVVLLLASEAWAFTGPEFKTSSPGFHRRRSPKLANHDGYKLPGNARPHMYDLTLTFQTIDESGDPSYTVDGEVLITLDVDPSTTGVKTNSLQINAAINWDTEVPATFLWNETVSCTIASFGGAYVNISCPEPIEGESQTLRIKYTTTLASSDEYGMYGVFYRENPGVTNYMTATQLEQDYARRIFPCFDEPEYKAPIKLTLKADTSKTYDLSNWIANTKVESETVDGTIKTTTFVTTPNMSTYLLAFVATTEFKNYSDTTLKADYDFEIFARPSAEQYVSIALENGPKLINLMGDYIGINYTTLGNDRMVLAAIPEFTSGAMENWGLITIREQILIDEGDATTARDKQYIIQVVAHELAHQWFGDYVTLDWWSETWLNEGFATYFEYSLPDQLSAGFDMSKQFVVKEKQQVLKTDGYPDTMPLSNNASEVTTDTDFLEEFGDVSYQKGACIVKILHQTLGDDIFKAGLQTYLHNNNHGNPTAKILLDTLQSAIPEGTTIDLNKLFKEWIYEGGYPLLEVSLNIATNKIAIEATKFSSSMNKSEENNTAIWWIPLTYTTSDKPDFEEINLDWQYSADLPDFSVTLPADAWILFNLQSIGFYRVNYDQTLWDRIITVLNNSETYSTIDVLNRAQLIDDIFNVAKSYQTTEENGTLYYSTAFKLIDYLRYETEYYPWYTFFTEMQFLMEIIQDNSTLLALKEKILELVSPQIVIPQSTDKPSHTEILKNNLLLNWACKLGHKNCTEWAQQQFEMYKNSTLGDVDTNYRDVVTCTGLTLTNTSKNDFNLIFAIVSSSDLPYEQLDLIKGLTCISKDYLLEMLLTSTVDYNPYETPFPRMFYDKIITTLMLGGFQKITDAITFVLAHDNQITQYWQHIEGPETLMKKIATKIYNQKHIDMFNDYITKYEPDAEYAEKIKAAKEAIEIAKENIEYLNQYSDILTAVIVDSVPPPPTTTTTTTETPTTTPGSSNKISFNILLASVLAFLLKYILC